MRKGNLGDLLLNRRILAIELLVKLAGKEIDIWSNGD